jgi:hypothetical protein
MQPYRASLMGASITQSMISVSQKSSFQTHEDPNAEAHARSLANPQNHAARLLAQVQPYLRQTVRM